MKLVILNTQEIKKSYQDSKILNFSMGVNMGCFLNFCDKRLKRSLSGGLRAIRLPYNLSMNLSHDGSALMKDDILIKLGIIFIDCIVMLTT